MDTTKRSEVAMPQILPMEEGAQYIGLTLRQLRELIANGQGPRSARIGRRRYIRVSDADAWLAAKFEADTDSDARLAAKFEADTDSDAR